MKRSIKRQLLIWLLIPLLSLAILSTFGSYFLAIGLAREIYDKQLLNSADSIVARMRFNGSEMIVDLSPAASAILRHNDRDEFHYQVVAPDGKVLVKDNILPPIDAIALARSVSGAEFETVRLNRLELRTATLKVPTKEFTSYKQVVLQVAETRNTRTELAGKITICSGVNEKGAAVRVIFPERAG